MKDSHLTLRIPAALAHTLARWARRHGVPKSQVVREAVTQYFAPVPTRGSSATLTALELAARWPDLPRLDRREAEAFGADIEAGRRALPEPKDPWASSSIRRS